MKRIVTLLSFLTLSVLSFGQTPEALKVRTFTLSNGMEVWINEDHSQPKAFGAVVVKAGAKDCPGTGIAHYFEHMMFKGTDKIGTVDYAAEKPYLDSIEVKYDELAVAPNDSVRQEIQLEINRLNIAASEYAIPNEFNNLITECGGSDLNAYTSQDITVYHNQFVPAFFEQWAELNSERLISPVFRLFQSELETVYEEKNMSDSNELSAFGKMISSEGFKGSPYQYEIIGTTGSLKNPQLSRMREFFDKYYVAGNMGLMLTGDIEAEKVLPVLEKTFGRIRKGAVEDAPAVTLDPYNGRVDVTAPVKIPIVKLNTLCYRAPSRKEDDCLPLSLLAFMLNNSEGIGMLDKLITDHKILAAYCMYPDMAFEDAGLFPILILPKLLFQSNRKAQALVVGTLDQLKAGDFTEEFFSSCKQTYRKHLLSQTESVGSRMNQMVNAYAEGRKWEDVLAQADRINALTKEDVVALANKYLGEDCLVITKKFGTPEMDELRKPPYRKVTPKNSGESSAYALAMMEAADKVELPRVIIDYENASRKTALSDKVALYSVGNELNDVFNLTLSYPVGTVEMPQTERLASYLNFLGTQTLGYEEHRARLQSLGGSLAFTAGRNSFDVDITGFDSSFEETLSLVSDLLCNPKGDKKKISILKESEMVNGIMEKRDIGSITSALFQYVAYGDDSYYMKDKGKLDDATLRAALEKVRSCEFDIHYSGALPSEQVAQVIEKCGLVDMAVNSHPGYLERNVALNGEPGVFFINKKRAPQSRIYATVLGDKLTDYPSRYSSYAFADYFGGGMGSVLFQEIREMRSMAYNTGAMVYKPGYGNREAQPTFLYSQLSTQCDKTLDAMSVMDSLLRSVPLSETRAKMVRKNLWVERITSYPDFRSISQKIVTDRRQGNSADPANCLYDLLENYSCSDVEAYWKSCVSGRNIVWTVVGDSRKIDMEALSKFGPLTTLKVKDVMKQ